MSRRRRSNRSVRRYAASTWLRFWWAKAASATDPGVSVHSSTQTRKLERKPWGTQGIPSRWSIAPTVFLDI